MSGGYKYGFIGGGNMAEAMIKGLLASGSVSVDQITVSDAFAARREYLNQTYKIAAQADNKAVAAGSAIIVLAVKPQVLPMVLPEIKSAVKPAQLVLSIAAGVALNKIEADLANGVPIVRAMPNAAALVLASATAISGNRFATASHMAAAKAVFDAVGQTVEVEEGLMNAVTGLSGSGPAYFFVILEALSDAGVLKGLRRDLALKLAAQTMLGAAKMALEPGAHPAQLKEMVTSPAGTTIHGLMALESGALRGLIMSAVDAATDRAYDLGELKK